MLYVYKIDTTHLQVIVSFKQYNVQLYTYYFKRYILIRLVKMIKYKKTYYFNNITTERSDLRSLLCYGRKIVRRLK